MLLDKCSRTVIQTCMGINNNDVVTILADRNSSKIGRSIHREAEKITEDINFYCLEDYGERPLDHLPDIIIDRARISTATFWTASPFSNELKSVRMPFCQNAIAGGRHAHMVGITEEVFLKGLSGDYGELARLTEQLKDILEEVDTLRITSEKGTELVARVDRYKWVASAGMLHTPGIWHNLPDGEVFTTPTRVEGTAVVDGTLGDYFDKEYPVGHTDRYPLTLKIENRERPVLTCIECDDDVLESAFREYVDQSKYSRVVGEIGLGTNIFLDSLMGNMLIDEKYPGIHIAFGDPIGSMTGAEWTCPTHIDAIIKECDIWAGELQIMERGKYLVDEFD